MLFLVRQKNLQGEEEGVLINILFWWGHYLDKVSFSGGLAEM